MPALPFDVQRFASHVGTWLEPGGPDADVAISCRVRLARNLAEYPFISRLPPARAEELCERMQGHLHDARIDGETFWVPLSRATPVLRTMLRERHLISRELSPSDDGQTAAPGRAVAFGLSESVAVMVNEEDHLRLQSLAPGFQLDAAWRRAQELDRFLEKRVPLAYTHDLGYLTGCPTNVGTGLRASVMLHLPALGLVRSELEKVFTAVQRTGLAVRGMYGEGSRAAGDAYQISNQITLGRSEQQLIDDLCALVPRIIDFERQVRETFLREQRSALRDRVSRSIGILRTARAMTTEAALMHVSNVRLGVHLGLCGDAPLEALNELPVQVQKGHLQALNAPRAEDGWFEPSERDRLRATLLRQRLAERGA
ncbi:MAG: ATP--guanido phosphotransferase [Planctomycetota bacterium]